MQPPDLLDLYQLKLCVQDWVLSSLESGNWVNEEPYEMVNFSPAVKKIRSEKEATNGAFKSELFRGESH